MRKSCCKEIGKAFEPRLFRALSDPTRIAIMALLASERRPFRVSEVAECCPVDLSVVSRHLSVLKDAGILSAEKRGKEVFYCMRHQDLSSSLRDLADAIDSCCPPVRKRNKEN